MKRRWAALAILLLALAYGIHEWSGAPREGMPGGDRAILDAFARQRSGIMVETAGTVERVLPDDLEGSRHQRFVVRLESDHTLLLSHNIDIAPRIPLAVGDPVAFRGQYEWNERGGVVHWTHHDPDGTRPGGWIRHRGKLYD
jgi:hypothetical protein